MPPPAQVRRKTSYSIGIEAEDAVCSRLAADGWSIRGRRIRTPFGEIDLAAERDGVLAIIEVKARPTLAEAAVALSPRQQKRLIAACGMLLQLHPDWGANGVRFDILLVDAHGRMRRIADAFREWDPAW